MLWDGNFRGIIYAVNRQFAKKSDNVKQLLKKKQQIAKIAIYENLKKNPDDIFQKHFLEWRWLIF